MSGNLGALNILLALNTASFQAALQKSSYQVKVFANQCSEDMKDISIQVNELGGKFNYIKNLLNSPHALIGGFLSIDSVIKTADAYGQYASRLRQVTTDSIEFKSIQNQLMDTSNRTFKSYEDATELFIRTSSALKQLGYDAQDAADLVSTVQFGLTIDSADVQKTKSVIDAISAAILSGKLDMQKFNTIVAASPTLFQALADSIANGSQQILREMVSDGKVSAEQLIAVSSQMDILGKKADEMPTTVADAMTRMQNNFAKLVGELNQSLGVTETLSGGLTKLADNLDVVAAAAGAFAGIYFSKKGLSGLLGISESIKNSKLLLEHKALQAIENQKLAASNIQLALAELNATQGTIAAHAASIKLSQARINEQLATQAANMAQKDYAASLTFTGRALSLVGGPMGLLTLAVTAGAAAWAYYSRDTEGAKQSIIDVTRPVTELKEEFLKLGRAQQSVVIADLESKIAQKTDPAEEKLKNLTNALTDGKLQWQVREIRELIDQELKGVIADTSLTAQELDQKILELFEGWQTRKSEYSGKGLFFEGELSSLQKLVGEFVSAQSEINGFHQKIAELKRAAVDAKSELKDFSKYLVPKGMEKWDEYLKNLENTRDAIGLNARELAEFQASQKGANEEQQKMAGVVAAQSDEYKNLQDAIARKDVAAEAAALENIKNLDIENQRLSLLAQKTLEVARLLEMVSSGAISAEMATHLKGIIENTYNLAAQSITEQSDESKDKVAKIKLNTVPTDRKGNRRGGGGGSSSGKESELQSLTKSLKEQVAVLGMTDLEAQKYKISLMQGSDAAKAYAVSLAETISRHKEEQETLKQNRMLLEEITVFRDKTMLPLDMMGWGDKAREQMNQVVGIREEYAQKRRQLEENQESESSRISDEAYQARLLALEEAESKKLAILEESFQRQKLLESNWALGATEALNNYAAETANIYASVGNLVGNAFQGMEDALLDFVMTGKLSFKDFANSIIKDMMRIFIQQQITGLFAQGLSGLFGGGVQTLGAPTTSWSFGTFPVAKANGGLITGPGTGTSDSIPAMLSNGEFVINARATRQNLRLLEAINAGRQPVYRANGGIVGNVTAMPSLQSYREGGNQITVNISNHGSQPVAGNAKMTTDDVGNRVIDIMLFDLNSNGRYAQQLKQMRR